MTWNLDQQYELRIRGNSYSCDYHELHDHRDTPKVFCRLISRIELYRVKIHCCRPAGTDIELSDYVDLKMLRNVLFEMKLRVKCF